MIKFWGTPRIEARAEKCKRHLAPVLVLELIYLEGFESRSTPLDASDQTVTDIRTVLQSGINPR